LVKKQTAGSYAIVVVWGYQLFPPIARFIVNVKIKITSLIFTFSFLIFNLASYALHPSPHPFPLLPS